MISPSNCFCKCFDVRMDTSALQPYFFIDKELQILQEHTIIDQVIKPIKLRYRKYNHIMAKRRIQKEFQQLVQNPIENISAGKSETDDFHWQATMIGPKGTPYEDGVFFLNIHFPNDYAFRPPKIHFITKIYHPNISPDGGFCIQMVINQWSPAFTISKALKKTYCIFTEVQNHLHFKEADVLYKTDRTKFQATAREWTKKYAQ